MDKPTEALRKTPLESCHLALGARMVPFAGYSMPVQYSGIIDEHTSVRTAAGLFDVSHMGEVRVQGPDAQSFVQWITTNDVTKLEPGKAQYSLLCKADGTLIDDIIVYCIARDHYFICVNASNRFKDFEWLSQHAKTRNINARLTDESDHFAQIALQGPKAAAIVQGLTSFDLASLKPFRFAFTKVGPAEVLMARTGYTGEDGFELYVDPKHAAALWNKLMDFGKPQGLKPVGLGARDTLRLEMKYSLYGNDIDEAHTALESDLGWVVKFDKGDFLGREALLKQKQQGVAQRLVGFKMLERGIARHGYPVVIDGKPAGIVTSGTHSPSLDLDIGCAYVPVSHAHPGAEIKIDIRGKTLAAVVVKTPFYSTRKDDT